VGLIGLGFDNAYSNPLTKVNIRLNGLFYENCNNHCLIFGLAVQGCYFSVG